MKSILTLFCLPLGLLFLQPTNGLAQEKATYLEQHSIKVNNLLASSPINILMDSAFSDYRVFITGEVHTPREENNRLRLAIFKYLYYRQGVRVLLIEDSYSEGLIQDLYLTYGLESMLSDRIAYKGNRKHFLDPVKSWWRTLPEDERFSIRGIDFEDPASALRALYYLGLRRPGNPKKPTGVLVFENDFVGQRVHATEMWPLLDSLKADWKKDTALYATFYGVNYRHFKRIFKGLRAEREGAFVTLNYDQLTSRHDQREELIHDNFKYVLEEFPEAKFFAQYGNAHVGTRATSRDLLYQNWVPFATRIQEDSTLSVAGKVCSIPIGYKKHYSGLKALMREEEAPFFKIFQDREEATLILLKGEDSPFDLMGYRFPFLIIPHYH